MGIFINTGNAGFQSARNGEYVDKSGLIAVVNRTLNTEQRFSCVTRCRRFGKSMAAKMLCAYYDHSCDSRTLFADLEIAKDPSFEKHLNKYPVIYLDISDFVTRYHDEEAVARGVDAVHDEHTSILSYNDENSLACVLSIAYYYAKNDYVMHRELATGRGFADIVLIPRKNVDSPAIVLELKYNQDADTAISQIKRKNYPEKVAQYTDNMLLVGINYDKQQKTHQCSIERLSVVTP